MKKRITTEEEAVTYLYLWVEKNVKVDEVWKEKDELIEYVMENTGMINPRVLERWIQIALHTGQLKQNAAGHYWRKPADNIYSNKGETNDR